MQLSPHFSLHEATTSQTATRKGWNNLPDDATLANMIVAADRLEKVRALFGGAPVFVSSWYRSPQLNRTVGGAKTSDHMTGFAIDFKVSGVTVAAAVEKIKKSGIKFDQLINEYGQWVHISFGPRMRQEAFKIG